MRNRVERGDDASVGFVAALRDDEVRKLGGDVDIRLFERAAGETAQAATELCTNGRLTGSKRWRKIVVAIA